MKKVLIVLLIAIIALIPAKVLAESGEIENTPVEEIHEGTDTGSNNGSSSSSTPGPTSSIQDQYGNIDDIMTQNVSINDLSNKIDKKLWEFAGVLQRWSIPVSIATFIIGCFLMILGALSKRGGIAPGLITCGVSILVYTLCVNAPAIVVAVSRWLMD